MVLLDATLNRLTLPVVWSSRHRVRVQRAGHGMTTVALHRFDRFRLPGKGRENKNISLETLFSGRSNFFSFRSFVRHIQTHTQQQIHMLVSEKLTRMMHE